MADQQPPAAAPAGDGREDLQERVEEAAEAAREGREEEGEGSCIACAAQEGGQEGRC
jgi:hypothetical protein